MEPGSASELSALHRIELRKSLRDHPPIKEKHSSLGGRGHDMISVSALLFDTVGTAGAQGSAMISVLKMSWTKSSNVSGQEFRY
jgi:hypothetical protein